MCSTVAAQEGPGIVIAHPGQDVELLCTVTEDSQDLTEAWIVNETYGPYTINSVLHGTQPGYNVNSDNNLIVENITMNDRRNGSEYECVIVPVPLDDGIPPDISKIKEKSNSTFLYVAGEYSSIVTCSS